jgi:hypothetical protein
VRPVVVTHLLDPSGPVEAPVQVNEHVVCNLDLERLNLPRRFVIIMLDVSHTTSGLRIGWRHAASRLPRVAAAAKFKTRLWRCDPRRVPAWRGNFIGAFALIAIVFVEVVVLVANGRRCPLTDVAAVYTPDRADNFDIYLPVWLARHNKVIFGWLFGAGLVFTVCLWRSRS